ncbi:MAG: hypothetical protein IJJ29_06935, partial [Solobacterium sp.]|nr:hypothetical protein [Solobacterium sp.]
MKKQVLVLLLGLLMIFSLAACGGSGDAEPAEEDSQQAEVTEEAVEETPAAAPEDIIVDEEAGTVTVTAQVNGTFFDQSTMHGVVFKDGGAADGAMMAAYCDSQDFFNAMVQAGGEPWNTTDAKLEDGEFTDGQKVDVTITWEGQDTPVALVDVLKTDDGKPDV